MNVFECKPFSCSLFSADLSAEKCGFSAHSAFLLNFGNTLSLHVLIIPTLPKILQNSKFSKKNSKIHKNRFSKI